MTEARELAFAKLETAAKELLVAVKYAGMTNFGTQADPNWCFEARVPTAFVAAVERALLELNDDPRPGRG